MSWRAPVAMVVAAVLATLVHGTPEAGTLAAFTASDTASGTVRAGSWITPGPTPTETPAPNPCLALPPENQHLCHIVPVRGTGGRTLPPLPTPTSRPLPSATPSALGGFFSPPPAATPAR